MSAYDLLSEGEKRNIITGRIRSLEYTAFSLAMELIEETATTVQDADKVDSITQRHAACLEKITALGVELEKYPAPAPPQ